jgi:hypothetical protein
MIRLHANQLILCSFTLFALCSYAAGKTKNVTQREQSIEIAEKVVGAINAGSAARDADYYLDLIKDGAEIVMSASSGNLGQIEELGFLNLFQVGDSSGSPSFERRLVAELMLLKSKKFQWKSTQEGRPVKVVKSPFSWHPTEFRPKSAFITSGAESFQGYRAQYGDMQIVFKKEIWRRTGFTRTDSLDVMRSVYYTGLSFENFISSAREPMVNSFTVDGRYVWDGVGLDYPEALIWGPLGLIDVDRIYLTREAYLHNKATVDRIRSAYGIDVFFYEPTDVKGSGLNVRMTRIERLKKLKNVMVSNELSTSQLINRLESETDPHTRLAMIDRLAFLSDPSGIIWLNNHRRNLLKENPKFKNIPLSNYVSLSFKNSDREFWIDGRELDTEFLWTNLALSRKSIFEKLLREFGAGFCSSLLKETR